MTSLVLWTQLLLLVPRRNMRLGLHIHMLLLVPRMTPGPHIHMLLLVPIYR